TSTNSQVLAGGAFAARVSVEGGAATDILVASNGNITAADGNALYLDATTGGFTTTAGGNTAASLDNLIANSKDATLT
ncbi:flagellin FliC, partial [Escherichia coli]|nr:flagellin FliC [Escherichia coli]